MPSALVSSVDADSFARSGGYLLRMPAVVRRTGLGRSTIYRLVARKQFPMPVRLTQRAVGWREADIERWSASLRPAQR